MVDRHHFSKKMMNLSTSLHIKCSVSINQIPSILNVVATNLFPNEKVEIPCRNTIKNWANKAGLKTYESANERVNVDNYALIIDDSINVGKNKLLMTLAVPASHRGRPLNYSDVEVFSMHVGTSFKAEEVSKCIRKNIEKFGGKEPKYVISDSATAMTKGIEMSGLMRMTDISHKLATFLSSVYKNEEDYQKLVSSIGQIPQKYVLHAIYAIAPPKMRKVVRFMNVGSWTDWCKKIKRIFSNLDKEAQEILGFLEEKDSLINGLLRVMSCFKAIESIFKHEGFYRATIDKCLKITNNTLLLSYSRERKIKEKIESFLLEEKKKIADNTLIYNNSSDVIESIFGVYKNRLSSNKKAGITISVLQMPLKVKYKDVKGSTDFSSLVKTKKMTDLSDWRRDNLPDTPMIMNQIILKKCS